ncbi:Uncharacterised protein [Staphylococcus microti]|uniref:Uncharacterized protein n=1 Tax=Staphylococcus microti TaxID=569857 RepID=A0A380GV46_9STAP|nr:hypothetical protein [Staphylococcus microti]PNZ82115.1 hypothetical protein CD132_05330 [Staphylococcus microti]SUM57633.1 Uncharacterised protein [Staphylococcus microti]
MNKSLAKIYCIKAMYCLIAAFANILTIIKTQNFAVAMLGVFLYFSPIAIENYAKSTHGKITIILRRIGYILPTLFLFFNSLLAILVIHFQRFSMIINQHWYIISYFIVSMILVSVCIIDIFLYIFSTRKQ